MTYYNIAKELSDHIKNYGSFSESVKNSEQGVALHNKIIELQNHLTEIDRNTPSFNQRCMYGNYESILSKLLNGCLVFKKK